MQEANTYIYNIALSKYNAFHRHLSELIIMLPICFIMLFFKCVNKDIIIGIFVNYRQWKKSNPVTYVEVCVSGQKIKYSSIKI